jgi:DNA-directed RNA polymerase sigma subunit (sigma70/sigma32)
VSAVAPEPKLTDNEAMVIRLRFGIGGIKERTLQEIADGMSITKQRVHQIEQAALEKLKKSEKLRGYGEGL